MPTAAFATLGCKVNQYETQRILDTFEERGFVVGGIEEPADVYVVNTCSVTQTAERKSRQMVRRLARRNPYAVIVLTGCCGEMMRIRGETAPEALIVVPNADKLHTLDHVLRARPDLAPGSAPVVQMRRQASRTRATVMVQDGCDVFCSYCSIPYTRSVMRSRPASEVIEEVRRLADVGHAEVVVTGVLVGAYGPDTGSGGPHLSELLRGICRVPGIKRVRLSSIEPAQVTDELMDVFAQEPALCRHLHIPLQSGSSHVLSLMRRPYDRAFYENLCARAYDRLADLGITTDILVGFPGETEEDFQETVAVVRTVGYARAHIFRFSPRPGTPAATLPDPVDETVKERRAHELAAACREAQSAFVRRFLGRNMDVLVEGKQGSAGMLSGYTTNYIRVEFAGPRSLVGKTVGVDLVAESPDGALGDTLTLQPEADVIPVTSVVGCRTHRG